MTSLKTSYKNARAALRQFLRFNFVVFPVLRRAPNIWFIGRRWLQYIPFFLPHDKAYHGFAYLARGKEGLFLDVGANDGISAVGFRRVNKNYRILSIEPNVCHERHLKKLNKRIKKFDYMLIGAGLTRSTQTMYIPVYNGVSLYTAATLRKEFLLGTLEKYDFRGSADKKVEIVEQKVEIIPLDELNLKPDIVKIDTEGFDIEVLLGMEKTIQASRPSILIECTHDPVNRMKGFFQKHNYRLFCYHHEYGRFENVDDKLTQAGNIFCVPSEKAQNLPTS